MISRIAGGWQFNWVVTFQGGPAQVFADPGADLRAQGINKWALTVQKSIAITEKVNFKFHAEFYNASNTTHFASPNTVVTSTSFSRITATFLGPRNLQMAARVTF